MRLRPGRIWLTAAAFLSVTMAAALVALSVLQNSSGVGGELQNDSGWGRSHVSEHMSAADGDAVRYDEVPSREWKPADAAPLRHLGVEAPAHGLPPRAPAAAPVSVPNAGEAAVRDGGAVVAHAPERGGGGGGEDSHIRRQKAERPHRERKRGAESDPEGAKPLPFAPDFPRIPVGGVPWSEDVVVYAYMPGNSATSLFLLVGGAVRISDVAGCVYFQPESPLSVQPLRLMRLIESHTYRPYRDHMAVAECALPSPAGTSGGPQVPAGAYYTLRMRNGTLFRTTAVHFEHHRRGGTARPLHRLCVMTMTRNRPLEFPDWLEYHRAIGVYHFVVLDNNSTVPLAPHVQTGGDVEVVMWPWRKSQPSATFYTRRLAIHRCEWYIHIDTDEYLYPRRAGNMRKLIESVLPTYGAVLLPSLVLGGGNFIRRRPEAPPLIYVTHGDEPWEANSKSLVRPKSIRDDMVYVHEAQTRDVSGTLTAKKDVASIVHFKAKSWEEYLPKYESRATSPDWKLPKNLTVDTPPKSSWLRKMAESSGHNFTEFRDFYVQTMAAWETRKAWRQGEDDAT